MSSKQNPDFSTSFIAYSRLRTYYNQLDPKDLLNSKELWNEKEKICFGKKLYFVSTQSLYVTSWG